MNNFEKIANDDEIILIEKNAIKSGLEETTLIKRAGTKIFDYLYKNIDKNKKILFVLGKGKNGQDGYIAYKKLINKKFNCKILLTFPQFNYDHWSKTFKINSNNNNIYFFDNSFKKLIKDCDLIIDCIFGTGLNRPLNSDLQKIIQSINKSNKYVISIDLPSGLSESAYKLNNKNVIIADKTLSLTAIKTSCLNLNTQKYAKDIINLDIGINKMPNSYVPKFLIDDKALKLIPNKNKYGNKRDFGNITIIGGSTRYPGAILMASKACIETGVGLISISIPNKIYNIVAGQIPEVSLQVGKYNNNFITIENIKIVLNQKSVNSVLIGPGMEVNQKTIDSMNYLIENIKTNKRISSLIIDADGLNCLSKIKNWWENDFPTNFVLTPHMGEMSRLTNLNTSQIQSDPINIVYKYAKKWNCTVILKGPLSYISDGVTVYVLNKPNPALAKGGTGDVLAGITAGFLTQKLNSIEGSILGVSLLSKLGAWSKEKYGALGSTASKLINGINQININE